MSNPKGVHCPTCHGTSTFKVSEGLYKCNYCQIDFRVQGNTSSSRKSVKIDELKELAKAGKLDELKNLAKTGQLEDMIKQNQQGSAPVVKKVFIGCFLSFFIAMAGIMAFIFVAKESPREEQATEPVLYFDSVPRQPDSVAPTPEEVAPAEEPSSENKH
jgi:hypothetical protein